MIVVYGSMLLGKVREMGTTSVVTRFAHLYYLPLVPTETHLVLERLPNNRFHSVPLPMNAASVFCGYARVWGPIVFAIGLVMLAAAHENVAEILTGLSVLSAGMVSAYFAYFHVGKLDSVEMRQRMIYWYHLGYPVDPADLGPIRHEFRARLHHQLASATHGTLESEYRSAPNALVAWQKVALDPSRRDPELVGAALTLARIDESLTFGEEQAAHTELHRQLWTRVEAEGWAPSPSP
jgi:hypothetical protein